ncbi:MAG: 1-acyl-sn-glycerol-3-phosphate acyltransferase [Oscillospiraceae bacterium]|nr:1-acyl-sn-glycerol-3-phosphate acyltransferase [Oscillospiraceae bacterium]MBR6677159.1 1-acyl-sn-glycerol-3-phosphate acyltransferase [Oscillospiraceae bacterium]
MLFPLFCAVSAVAAGITAVNMGLFGGAAGVLWFLLLGFGYFVLLTLLWLLPLVIFSFTVDQSKPAGKHQKLIRSALAETLLLLFSICRVRIHVSGIDMVPTDSRYLFTSNHISIFDPLASLIVMRKKDMTFISKKENMSRPVIGNLMHAAGMLPIDRENDRSAVRTVVQAAKLMKDDYTSVGLYPEGYTNRQPNTVLLPFRDGSLKTAQKAGVPVVVAVIRGSNRVHFPEVLLRWKTEIRLDFLTVIPAEEVCSVSTHELGEKMWKIMYRELTGEECESIPATAKENEM